MGALFTPISCNDLPADGRAHTHSLQTVLGDAAWSRLPQAVRVRFADPAVAVDYVGEFDIVRASWLGRVLALACRLLGTPVVPRTGLHIPAIVHVGPTPGGVAWNREYRWPDGRACLVRSTKTFDASGRLVERLPARLCMPLQVCEQNGVLHFISRGYYFDFGGAGKGFKLPLPKLFSPGTTHVKHIDEAGGWFRFTMTVTHPFFGEMFHQTGRFRAAGEQP
jgi:hypothetical protein